MSSTRGLPRITSGGGGGGGSAGATALAALRGALNENVTGADPETVVGGFVLTGADVSAFAPTLQLLGALSVAGAGDGFLRLYDMGVVGTAPAAGVLRSEVQIANADAGGVIVREQLLTVVAVPGVNVDEIAQTRNRYEVRAQLVGGAAPDLFEVRAAGIVLG